LSQRLADRCKSIGGPTPPDSRLFKLIVGFVQSIEADKAGHNPMIVLLTDRQSYSAALVMMSFTWIKKAAVSGCHLERCSIVSREAG
jgi:hypothetical protein